MKIICDTGAVATLSEAEQQKLVEAFAAGKIVDGWGDVLTLSECLANGDIEVDEAGYDCCMDLLHERK